MDETQRQAARDFADSFSHLHEVTYGSRHRWMEGIHVSDYREAMTRGDFPAEVELTVIDATPDDVRDLLASDDLAGSATQTINLFHDPQADVVKSFGPVCGEVFYTAPLQQITLPALIETDITIREAFNQEDVDWVNGAMKDDVMPTSGVDTPLVRRFYATLDDSAAGWAQMVMSVPGVAYIGGMITREEYRRRGVARALLNRIHEEAHESGCNRVLLVPSDDARDFYTRHGYETVVPFTVFKRGGNAR